MQTLPLTPETVPLDLYEGKAYRIRGTRVTLESVISVFKAGMTVEGIVDAFPTIELADAYAVISYYLRHRPAVEAYLTEQQSEADRKIAEATAKPEYQARRERLLARAGRSAKAS
jgi:uncharacterized protein (DUF433 family)